MKKNTTDKIIKCSITLVFILLPFIDILRTTRVKDIEIFNIAVIEFINIALILISFMASLYKRYESKEKIKLKSIIFVSIYLLILGIYLVLHCINIFKFDINIYGKAKFSFLIELYYIFRVYILPLILIITLIFNKDIFNKEYYISITKYLIYIIAGSIVILNLFRFSYSSYASDSSLDGNYQINNTNFFDVFEKQENYKELLTSGLFPSANQISIILVMLLPFNIYNLYKNKKILNIFLLMLQTFAMIIVGTKVAALGATIILISTLCMYIFFAVINKKCDKKYIIMHGVAIIFAVVIISISPFAKLMNEKKSLSFEKHSDIETTETEELEAYEKTEETISNEEIVNYIYQNSYNFKIDKLFFDIYPIEGDIDFWIQMAKQDKMLNNDYRILKNNIMSRIFERNNEKTDILFGLGYTLDFMDMERDYVYQYYLFGIVGVILLMGIYIYMFLKNIFMVLNRNKFKYKNCICIVSSLFGLILCYFSGHLFGWVSPMLILAITLCAERSVIIDE